MGTLMTYVPGKLFKYGDHAYRVRMGEDGRYYAEVYVNGHVLDEQTTPSFEDLSTVHASARTMLDHSAGPGAADPEWWPGKRMLYRGYLFLAHRDEIGRYFACVFNKNQPGKAAHTELTDQREEMYRFAERQIDTWEVEATPVEEPADPFTDLDDVGLGAMGDLEYDPNFTARDLAGVLVRCLQDWIKDCPDYPHLQPAHVKEQEASFSGLIGTVYLTMEDGKKYVLTVTSH